MNTESPQESNAKLTIGERLRQAREHLGLSHQTVAERLCLKVSIIRQIEEEATPADIVPTFLRGYLRSYAKLVHVPEKELLGLIGKQAPIKAPKVMSIQEFSLSKSRKKCDGWLIVFFVIGLMSVLWWQNHQARQEAATMIERSSAQLNHDNSQGQAIPLGDNADSPPTVGDMSSTSATMLAPAEQIPTATSASQLDFTANGPPIGDVQTAASAGIDPQTVTFTLKADCWFQINDASGKVLFSGIKRGGETFSVKGTAPYKLKIGAPGAIDIQFQGRSVDLSYFIKSSRVARLTLAAE